MKSGLDDRGMIEKIANNDTNQEILNLNPISKITEKLNWYRGFFGKIDDLDELEFESLKLNISTFFNLKPVTEVAKLPSGLIRISNNNRILNGQGKPLKYLTHINELLAPPIDHCGFGRCNLPKEQVLYCGIDDASVYWETKPQLGDVISISRFKLKDDAEANCIFIKKEKISNSKISHDLEKVYHLLDEFFIEVFTLEVSRERPKDYLFSALLSSDQLFYPHREVNKIDAIIYPSVQRKRMGANMAIRNDVIFEKYKLETVETKFILNEFENLDPSLEEPTTDCVMGSFYTHSFDLNTGQILYSEEVDKVYEAFRSMQLSNNQVRYENGPDIPKNIAFNLSARSKMKTKYGRNEKINVQYQDGVKKNDVKFKKVEQDIIIGKCTVIR